MAVGAVDHSRVDVTELIGQQLRSDSGCRKRRGRGVPKIVRSDPSLDTRRGGHDEGLALLEDNLHLGEHRHRAERGALRRRAGS